MTSPVPHRVWYFARSGPVSSRPEAARRRTAGAAEPQAARGGSCRRCRLLKRFDGVSRRLPALEAILVCPHVCVAQVDQALGGLRTLRALRSAAVRDDLGVLRNRCRRVADGVERHPGGTWNDLAGEVLAGQHVPQVRDAWPWSSRCRSSPVEIVRVSSMSLSSSIWSMMAVDSAHGISISKRQAGQKDAKTRPRPAGEVNGLQNVMGCFTMKSDARGPSTE